MGEGSGEDIPFGGIYMYVLGIDIGTTGTKSVLMNDKGSIVKSAYKAYGLIKSANNIVEQKADDWWHVLVSTVRECTGELKGKDKESIKALSVSSQGGSMVPVDKDGNPLSNVIVWMDKRGTKQQTDLLNLHNDEFYYKKTGWKLSCGGNLIQIRWLKENKPDIFSKTYKFLSTIDYINYKLTGNYVIDPSNAAMTNLMDIQKKTWDNCLLDAAGISEARLAGISESGEAAGRLTAEAAGQLGLSTSIKVINGGHDQYCAAIGTGAIEAGQLFLSAGTAWVLIGVLDKPIFNPNTYIAVGRHIIKGLWGALVSVPTGGVAMEWFKENLGIKLVPGNQDAVVLDESLKDIDSKASGLMERSRNVYFYPYFIGSGYPNYNTDVKAALIGLGLEHDRYDMALAVTEGIAFEINHAIEEFREKGCKLDNLRMIGGGSKSTLWTEIIANVTGIPVIRLKHTEAACTGAAIIAGVGCGIFKDYIDGYSHITREETIVAVDDSKREFYKAKYGKYKQGIKAIEKFFNI